MKLKKKKKKKKKNIMRKRMIAEIIYVQQKRERRLLFLLGIKFVCFFFFGHFSLFSESKRPRKALVFRIGEL